MIDANFDWTSWLFMLVGTFVSIYAQIASNRRWVGILVPFVAAFPGEIFAAVLMKHRPFDFWVVVVFGVLFLIIGSLGASQYRRSIGKAKL